MGERERERERGPTWTGQLYLLTDAGESWDR